MADFDPETATVHDFDAAGVYEDTHKYVIEFTKRYVNLLLEEKRIKEDIKALRQEYEELGVPTKIAIKALNEQKKIKKTGYHEMEEVELYLKWISESTELDDVIAELIA